MSKIFNFGAGPSMLPVEVLKQAQKELTNWNNMNISVMEVNHRSKEFLNVVESCEKDLRDLLNIPENYKVLFCHGGARAQFSAIPMNLMGNFISARYINNGYWSKSAIHEAQKYCNLKIIKVIENYNGYKKIKSTKDWNLYESKNIAYTHYCQNETVDGLSIHKFPKLDNEVLIADFSSSILSHPLNISDFGMIYASTQKNIGTSGLALIIIREDLLYRTKKSITPSFLNYEILANNNSIFNTPVIFTWYLSSLVLKWLKQQGGLKKMQEYNLIKSNLIYQTIDTSDFYINKIHPKDRSNINITFELLNPKLNELFLQKSKDKGLYFLKGHRSIGGMRISLYNAMPIEGVKKLVDFMKLFAKHQA